MAMKIIRDRIRRAELVATAKDQFGDLVKAVVDVEQRIIAIGGELHADEEALLIEQGSRPEDLWGINLYPDKPDSEWIEFDSIINVRPSQGNPSRGIEDAVIRGRIAEIVGKLAAS